MTYEEFRRIALSFPGVEEGSSYGMPAFKLRAQFFTRLRDDGDLVLPADHDEREMLCDAEPATFHVTEHYRGSRLVLARLERAHAGTVSRLLEQAWRQKAMRKTVAAYDAARGAGEAE